jgi:hypothetical protein
MRGMLGCGRGGLGEVCVGTGEGMLEEGLLESEKWRFTDAWGAPLAPGVKASPWARSRLPVIGKYGSAAPPV